MIEDLKEVIFEVDGRCRSGGCPLLRKDDLQLIKSGDFPVERVADLRRKLPTVCCYKMDAALTPAENCTEYERIIPRSTIRSTTMEVEQRPKKKTPFKMAITTHLFGCLTIQRKPQLCTQEQTASILRKLHPTAQLIQDLYEYLVIENVFSAAAQVHMTVLISDIVKEVQQELGCSKSVGEKVPIKGVQV
ncbi:ubiquitin-protein ligase [Culex quinquefasciatus]|uniref:Ubiquitin-protein ligase n=1 Tax=Culex quinquefasciatus TaxID=7176 RepID=B0VZ16_CULQU|nr:ubiquitin-protein ligase [Culex quinquefasciatus]|eukprot:XP_001841714.1 ubiquitin-protein ligase [Culex quinquefasciatus]